MKTRPIEEESPDNRKKRPVKSPSLSRGLESVTLEVGDWYQTHDSIVRNQLPCHQWLFIRFVCNL